MLHGIVSCHRKASDTLSWYVVRSQTVGDIRRFIAISRPDVSVSYRLLTTFPQKQLDDDAATIQAAGLANAVVTQKLS